MSVLVLVFDYKITVYKYKYQNLISEFMMIQKLNCIVRICIYININI